MKLRSLLALAVAAPVLSTQAAMYELDTAHSTIGFSVRHMMVTSVKGTFGEFQGVIQYTDGEVETVSASAEVDVASVDTGNEKRDDHLRNEDFFDAETYPAITFVSTGAEGDLPDITLYGDLTMRGTTKPVALKGQLNGPVTNPWGQTVIGLELETTINRQDFGVAWSKTLDEGGLVVGDKVKLQIALEAIQQSGDE